MTDNPHISIVTMFFDIGRGNWSSNHHNFKRNNDEYFSYFSHLAKLDNDITIFTTSEFSERIQNIRKDKPTNIVCINLDDFQFWTNQLAKIIGLAHFNNFIYKLGEFSTNCFKKP